MAGNIYGQTNYGSTPLSPKTPHSGRVNLIVLVVFSILLLATIIFGIWAYSSMLDYKNNSDKKASQAVKVAEQKLSSQKDNEFAEKEKKPYKTYKGPETYGSITFEYPKTWSGYVNQIASGSSQAVDGYFYPDIVPGLATGSSYALRLQVVNQTYAVALSQFDAKVKTGKIAAKAFRAKNVPDTLGAQVDGEIFSNITKGSLVALPLRDKTILLWTESDRFSNDFSSIILPSLTFIP